MRAADSPAVPRTASGFTPVSSCTNPRNSLELASSRVVGTRRDGRLRLGLAFMGAAAGLVFLLDGEALSELCN